ncbi:hypothetical protein EYF80_048979 [Liparis tanakae]|uniref:Uncharacterized protein n=1 Tax=Liparis tanakae TaxID=230148 RepID=A0A4Z2FIR2_9TELE|nr:hypothetical protein EYF80_048979 [Liparis tanakae]
MEAKEASDPPGPTDPTRRDVTKTQGRKQKLRTPRWPDEAGALERRQSRQFSLSKQSLEEGTVSWKRFTEASPSEVPRSVVVVTF